MRVIGIDTGPKGIAWAIYDDKARQCTDPPMELGDVVEWGECSNWPGEGMPVFYDAAAIEWPVIFPGAGNEIRDTIATAGMWLGRLGKDTLLIPRATIASALHARGDARINAVMKTLCPTLDQKCEGLNHNVRAAAAVAYVAVGRRPK